MERGRLSAPLLYLSGYFDRRRDDYYDRLQYVRERGEINEWLLFFLDGIAVQAADAVERAERLSDLREKFRAQLGGTSAQQLRPWICSSRHRFSLSAMRRINSG